MLPSHHSIGSASSGILAVNVKRANVDDFCAIDPFELHSRLESDDEGCRHRRNHYAGAIGMRE
jgi:hypothetical protein